MYKNCTRCGEFKKHYLYLGKPKFVCKDCWRENNKVYVSRYIKKNPALRLRIMHNYNFGGNRELVLKRDKYQCVNCGMNRDEHRLRYHCDITIDHIDRKGNGLKRRDRNNHPDNLQTLCLSCHGKKDGYLNRMGALA